MTDTLDRKPAGARVRIERIDGALATRLAELGLVPGSDLEVVRALPFGGPMVLDRGGFRFALRRADARTIFVTHESEPGIPPESGAEGAEGEVE